MGIKDLLVTVDLSESGQARIDYAFGLAEAHGAHLIGVAYAPNAQEATTALDGFAKASERRGLSAETRLITCKAADLPDEMALHVRHVDIAVVGQPDEGEDGAGPQHALLNELLFSAGRPLLLVPWAGKANPEPETVMVGWDASGTAARALADALPILRRAKKVVVVIAIGDRRGDHGEEPGADITLHIARHGIVSEARRIPLASDVDVADLLLSQAADLGAEMIVMGGYHHSRLRESVLGGVTRTVLETMTVPVLMSH